ncbi:MAG: hypothetical protein ACJ763_13430 [Bdellovibrionia bacterium]
MRTFILIAAAFLIQQQAFAGYGQCRRGLDLVCEATMNKKDGSSRMVTSGAGRVYDQEQEYFDAAECEGSVVLYTDAGKFVANYRDYDGTVRAWIDPIEGRERLLIDAAPIDTERKTSVTVPMYSNKKYESVTFTCYTQVNYQYNPRE